MSVRAIQWAIGAVYFILGGWALLAPSSVIELTFLPEYRTGTRILPLAIACLGAQAMISGLFAAFSRFARTTYLAYGIALLPFFCVQLVVHVRRPGVHQTRPARRGGECGDAGVVRGGMEEG